MKTVDPVLDQSYRPSIWLALSVLMSAVVTIAIAKPTLAQVTSADTLQQAPQSGEYNSDPFSSNGNGQMNSVFDLIHRANMGGGRSLSEVQEEQRENISSEAADFRARQMELLQQENGTQSSTSSDTPQQN